MSHPDQQTIIKNRQKRNKAQLELQKECPKNKPVNPQNNSTCKYESVEDEILARNKIVTDQIKCIKTQLPVLLKQLDKIKDPRNPKKIKHKKTMLLIYNLKVRNWYFNVCIQRSFQT